MIPETELQNSARGQFQRARRHAVVERIVGWLRGRSASLLCYRQDRPTLLPQASRRLGVQEIPLEAIVGSVERCSDYTRGFMPLKDSDQGRWTRIMKAARGAQELPPIRAYRVGEIYYVVDGHHRVSVARQRGLRQIAAYVVEVPEERGSD